MQAGKYAPDMTIHEPSWDDARAAAFAAARQLESIDVPIDAALGLTLAEALVARSRVPGFDTSMMDGWAVSGFGPWTITGSVLAGSVPAPIASGEAVLIATGAPVPVGATAVLRREWGEVIDDRHLRTDREIRDHMDIRFAGDEANVGDVLLAAGTVVTPPVIGLAALVGVDTLRVTRPASIEALVMGDEIITSGIPSVGKVRDALGVQLRAWAADFACTDNGIRYVEDTLQATIEAISGSAADVVFTTGGTARGPVDHIHHALEALDAELVVDEVKVRPGHPMLLARLPGGRFVIGLPGNPLAAITGYMTLGAPLLAALAGRGLPGIETCVTTTDIEAPASDRRLIPAQRTGDSATPTRFWGSAMLRGIAQSDCLLVSEPGGARAGDRVGVLPLPWHRGY